MFAFRSKIRGDSIPFEYYAGKSGETIQRGQLLVMEGGVLTACAPTAWPEFICAGVPAASGLYPVMRVTDDVEFAAPLTAAGTALKEGDTVAVSTGGMGLSATTASVGLTISGFYGKAVGDLVTGYFKPMA